MKEYFKIFIFIIFLSTSCRVGKNATGSDDGKIEVNLIQVNDVYEIAPIAGGKEGGMARIATLKKQ